jgi:hypothetical protein
MNQLPKELQDLIYNFDNTYRLQFDEVLKLISKKTVSIFKHRNKYIHCGHCNTKVQNLSRHWYTSKHQFNLSIQGFVPWYKAIYDLTMDYIIQSETELRINGKNDMYRVLQNIELDPYNKNHDTINNYFDPRVIYMLYIYNNELSI